MNPYWLAGSFPRRTGPVCYLHGRRTTRGPESSVVAGVIGELLSMGVASIDIHLEYRIDAANRVDVAVLDDPEVPLLVECKKDRIRRNDVKQGVRYLMAARNRWPASNPLVVLAAPDVDQTILPPPGVALLRVAAAS